MLDTNILLAHMLGSVQVQEELVTLKAVLKLFKNPQLILNHNQTHAVIRRLGTILTSNECPNPKTKKLLAQEAEPYIREQTIFDDCGNMCIKPFNIDFLNDHTNTLNPRELKHCTIDLQ